MQDRGATSKWRGERSLLMEEIEEYYRLYGSGALDDDGDWNFWVDSHPRFAAYWSWQQSLDPDDRSRAVFTGDRHLLNWYFDGLRPSAPSPPTPPAPTALAPVPQPGLPVIIPVVRAARELEPSEKRLSYAEEEAERKRRRDEERKLIHKRNAETNSAFLRGMVYPNPGVPDWMRDVWGEVWDRDGGKCVRCDEDFHLVFCYVVPPSWGGVDEITNLVMLCRDCQIPVLAESERVGSGISLLKRIVPREVDQEPPPYVVPEHHQLAKAIWVIGAIAVPSLVLAGMSDALDFGTTLLALVGFLFGTFLIFPVVMGLAHVYDKFLLPDKLRAEAAHEAWQKVRNEWRKERPKIARMGVGTRSRYISNQVKGEVWARDGGRCVECSSTIDLQFDHIVPFSLGGGNHTDNIQLLCQRCNLKKSNKIAG